MYKPHSPKNTAAPTDAPITSGEVVSSDPPALSSTYSSSWMLGAAEGTLVYFVGIMVGLRDHLSDGRGVSTIEGKELIPVLGARLSCALLGTAVDCTEGCTVGCTVGSRVGLRVGTSEGLSVRRTNGDSVGLSVALNVGLGVLVGPLVLG